MPLNQIMKLNISDPSNVAYVAVDQNDFFSTSGTTIMYAVVGRSPLDGWEIHADGSQPGVAFVGSVNVDEPTITGPKQVTVPEDMKTIFIDRGRLRLKRVGASTGYLALVEIDPEYNGYAFLNVSHIIRLARDSNEPYWISRNRAGIGNIYDERWEGRHSRIRIPDGQYPIILKWGEEAGNFNGMESVGGNTSAFYTTLEFNRSS